jgi:hypothetical protein
MKATSGYASLEGREFELTSAIFLIFGKEFIIQDLLESRGLIAAHPLH